MKQLGRATGNRLVSLMGCSVRNDIPALGGEQARQYGTSTQNTAQVLSGKSWWHSPKSGFKLNTSSFLYHLPGLCWRNLMGRDRSVLRHQLAVQS